MPLDEFLLSILVCPENKTPVKLASHDLILSLNDKIIQGSLKNRGGQIISEKIESGLIREDGRVVYPVRENIPIMLIEEGIQLQN